MLQVWESEQKPRCGEQRQSWPSHLQLQLLQQRGGGGRGGRDHPANWQGRRDDHWGWGGGGGPLERGGVGAEGEAVRQVEGEVLHPHQGLPSLLQEGLDTADRVRTIPIQGLFENSLIMQLLSASCSLSHACQTIPHTWEAGVGWLLPNPNRTALASDGPLCVSDRLTSCCLWCGQRWLLWRTRVRAVIGIRVEREPPVSQRQTSPPCQSTWPEGRMVESAYARQFNLLSRGPFYSTFFG